jgi:hypothetical protein
MLATDVLKMLHGLERKEAAASSTRGFTAVARLYAAAADKATATDLRLALLAEVVRLADDSTASLTQAAQQQQDIANGLADDDAALAFLARLNHVELLEQARAKTTGMPPPQREHVHAMQALVRAAKRVAEPFPQLLALELLAAALWAQQEGNEDRTVLRGVVDEIAALSPVRWRSALHRAHVALASGNDDDVATALAAARDAGLPDDNDAYVWGLEAVLATRRGDLEHVARCVVHRREAGSYFPEAVQLPVWAAPVFIFAEEPRAELSIELWRRLPGGLAHAQFIATRLAARDPKAQWRREQARELGVEPWRPHDVLVAEVLAA